MAASLPIQTMGQLRLFMQHHVFAVWDFMLLLKALQQQLAPSGSPWLPSPHPRAASLINQLIAEEECDCLPVQLGGPCYLSHFEIYLLAMEEVGAYTAPIKAVLQLVTSNGLEAALKHPAIPQPSQRFMAATQLVIRSSKAHLLAAAFCYGREQLVSGLFRELRDQLVGASLHAPILLWYLERHIALDGDSHGPLAEDIVIELCKHQPLKLDEVAALRTRVEQERATFWDDITWTLGSSTSEPQLTIDEHIYMSMT